MRGRHGPQVTMLALVGQRGLYYKLSGGKCPSEALHVAASRVGVGPTHLHCYEETAARFSPAGEPNLYRVSQTNCRLRKLASSSRPYDTRHIADIPDRRHNG